MKLHSTMPTLGLISLALAAVFPQAQAAEFRSYSLDDQTLTIQTDEGPVALTAWNDDALEVFYQPDGVKQLPSFATTGKPKDTKMKVKDKGNTLVLKSGHLTAEIQKSPIQIRYLHNGEPLLQEEKGLFVEDTVRGFRFKLTEDEKILGGGERVLGMDRRGHKMPLYNKAHYGYTTESNQMYYGLPAVMSTHKYMLVFDNSASGNLDIGATESDVLQFDAVGGRTSYLVVAGDSYPKLIQNYVSMVGKQPMPPMWALGNIASRFGYHTEQEARDTIAKFKTEDFPVDGIVLDLYWFGKDVQGHMGNLDWDKDAFPTPENMLADFKQQGVNTVVITEPFVLSTSKRWEDAVEAKALATNAAGNPRRFDFYFGNTGLIDVFNDQASAWFNQIYTQLYRQGVTGWWGDLGEPEVHPYDAIHNLNGISATADEVHNAYGHQWAERVFDNQRKLAPKERPFIMMRSGFVGSQRYGMIPWTGDVSRSWGGLVPQVELSLQMGLFGLGYTHSDLGGFAGGETFDQEMYIRWLEYGVFQPVFRPHAQDNIAPEPVFHDEQTKDILREYVKLRYRMLPYNYTLAWQNSQTGMPLMRPLFFADEQNSALIDIKDKYMWGDAFLVQPITQPGVTSVTMELPKGVWFNFWTDERASGANPYVYQAALNTLPVMVKAGSFVPMVDDLPNTKAYSSERFTLHYYNDASVKKATGQMYVDDGNSFAAYQQGDYQLLNFTAGRKNTILSFDLSSKGKGFSAMPQTRTVALVVHNQDKPCKVLLDGKVVDSQYDASKRQLTVTVPWSKDVVSLVIYP